MGDASNPATSAGWHRAHGLAHQAGDWAIKAAIEIAAATPVEFRALGA
ncbi:MAG: hypothetical protein ACRD3O_17155 [Terriglobia bacterium]